MANNNTLAPLQNRGGLSVKDSLNMMLDKNNYRRRFQDLLGKRMPQFIASLVSLVNADEKMQVIASNNPASIIQSALKAATYDLPVDPGLGFAYIVPFGKDATFVIGYKGMLQLAMRTGSYKKINVIDIRSGELVSRNRLTEDYTFNFIADDAKRENTPIVGYCGYFQQINGMEKTLYMSIEEIKEHEKKHRKGNSMGKGWRENFDAMARKTVLRKMLNKWGMMSIDYKKSDLSDVIEEERQIINANANSQPLDVAPQQIPQPQPQPQQQPQQQPMPQQPQPPEDIPFPDDGDALAGMNF